MTWDAWVKLYNTNQSVQALTLVAFWGVVYFLVIRIFFPKKDSGGNNEYWRLKKELYDQMRKRFQELLVTLYGQLDQALVTRALELGVPTEIFFAWDEAHEWERFFRVAGSILLSQFFQDMENNGFDQIGLRPGEKEAETVNQYLEGKKKLVSHLVEEAIRDQFAQQSLTYQGEKNFQPRKRVLTYSDILAVFRPPLETLAKETTSLYKEAISRSKQLMNSCSDCD